MLDDLKKKYETQDNRGTAWPIFVTVQELMPVGVIAEGYSQVGDGETRYEHNCECCDKHCHDDDGEENPDCSENVQVGYIWQSIQFFLTIEGANDFIRTDKHNHGKLRTYVDHFHRRNFEMNDLMKELGFKVEG